jgi:uncharacterized protein YceH (UPF0502 family)
LATADGTPEFPLQETLTHKNHKKHVKRESSINFGDSGEVAKATQPKQSSKILKKDLELLDAEIAELDKELAKATEKLNIV